LLTHRICVKESPNNREDVDSFIAASDRTTCYIVGETQRAGEYGTDGIPYHKFAGVEKSADMVQGFYANPYGRNDSNQRRNEQWRGWERD